MVSFRDLSREVISFRRGLMDAGGKLEDMFERDLVFKKEGIFGKFLGLVAGNRRGMGRLRYGYGDEGYGLVDV